MNCYIRAGFVVLFGTVKMLWTKLFHFRKFRGPILCMISPLTEITIDRKATLTIGKMFKMRDGAKIRVRGCAVCKIGDNTSINSNNIIGCHERIEIGDNVQLSPNVQIYDHDHDFRVDGGLIAQKYKTSPVRIGNNVWIGANTVILRGTQIEDNCVVGAGCVIKGKYVANTRVLQKRETSSISYVQIK